MHKPDLPLSEIRKLWEQLGGIPVDNDGLLLEPFLNFEEGTDREYIWHWFENHFDNCNSVHDDIMFPAAVPVTDIDDSDTTKGEWIFLILIIAVISPWILVRDGWDGVQEVWYDLMKDVKKAWKKGDRRGS